VLVVDGRRAVFGVSRPGDGLILDRVNAHSRIWRSSPSLGRGSSTRPGWSGSCRAIAQHVPAPAASGTRPTKVVPLAFLPGQPL